MIVSIYTRFTAIIRRGPRRVPLRIKIFGAPEDNGVCEGRGSSGESGGGRRVRSLRMCSRKSFSLVLAYRADLRARTEILLHCTNTFFTKVTQGGGDQRGIKKKKKKERCRFAGIRARFSFTLRTPSG